MRNKRPPMMCRLFGHKAYKRRAFLSDFVVGPFRNCLRCNEPLEW